MVLLRAEWSADALSYLAGSVIACDPANISTRGLRELNGAAFDRLLLGAHRKGPHPSVLQGEHAPIADHLPRDAERFIGSHLSGGLLQHDRAQARSSNTACCSVSFASTRSSIARPAAGRSGAPISRTA